MALTRARPLAGDADALYAALTQMIRLCLTGPFERKEAPPGLIDLLMGATDLPDIGVLEAHVKETAQRVRSHFGRLLRAGGT
jgi:glutamate-ammonia-ligase adenylyltransferase